jgi:hypothetical protein
MIFMMSYFYIFKYGRALGQFLYNSAEVKMIPVESIDQGIFINKNFIKQIMGSRLDLNSLKKELKEKLNNEDWQLLESLINRKTKSEDDKQKESIDILKNLRLKSMPNLISKGLSYQWQKDADKDLIKNINQKLSKKQQNDLDNILKSTDDVQKFLKLVRGRLTKEQALELKNMIEERNKEVEGQGLDPVKHIILHKTFSFAPFMLLGVVITLLTQSSIIHLIYEYILHR